MHIVKFIHVIIQFIFFFNRGLWTIISVRDNHEKHKRFAENTSHVCKKIANILGVNVKLTNPEKWAKLDKDNFLVVANHVSYLDIMILTSIREFLFITSTDMQKTPFLGQLCELGGSLFTNRKNAAGIKGEIINFAKYLDDGFNVVLFPEGTSTDGKEMKNFKKSLFQIAIEANKSVLPICIKYTDVDGKPISDENRNKVYWYGDDSFLPHILRVVKLKEINIEVTLLDEVVVNNTCDRKAVSNNAFEQINSKYKSYSNL